MSSQHKDVAIAEIVFYAPIVPLSWYLFWRNAAVRPRMAWWPIIPFALFRLVGGILVVVLAKQPDNIGLIIGALICLNVGVIPLVAATLGMVRKCVNESFPEGHILRLVARGTRFALIIAIILLATSGGLSSGNADISRSLAIGGYLVLLITIVWLAAFQLYTLRLRSTLTPISRTIVTYSILASPFLIVRAVYGVIYVFNSSDIYSYWNPLFGNAVVFAIMALLMEYIALVIYIYIGLVIPPSRGPGADEGARLDGAKVHNNGRAQQV